MGAVSNLQKNTSDSFSATCRQLHQYHDKQGRPAPLISDAVQAFVSANSEELDAVVDYVRDQDYDYFGFKTLERSYLLRVHGKIVERPQHLLMRVAIGIHKDVEKAIDTYHMLSERWMTHAS